MKRAVIIVLDSLGIGELPDAYKYGDEGSNTLGNIVKAMNNNEWFSLRNLEKMGLGYIDGVDYLDRPGQILGAVGRMAEMSKGKDTTTGQ